MTMKLYCYAVTVTYESRETRREFMLWSNALAFYARHTPGHARLDVWNSDSGTWELALSAGKESHHDTTG